MERSLKIKVRKIALPDLADYLLGMRWSWSLYQWRDYDHLVTGGFTYTEKAARRKAQRAARRLVDAEIVEYEYNPAGLL